MVSAGVYNGVHATIAAATTILCAGAASSMSMCDFTSVGATSPYARIMAKPPPDNFQFPTNITTLMELNSNGATFPGDVAIQGTLTGECSLC